VCCDLLRHVTTNRREYRGYLRTDHGKRWGSLAANRSSSTADPIHHGTGAAGVRGGSGGGERTFIRRSAPVFTARDEAGREITWVSTGGGPTDNGSSNEPQAQITLVRRLFATPEEGGSGGSDSGGGGSGGGGGGGGGGRISFAA
jgi:hypothetical protein